MKPGRLVGDVFRASIIYALTAYGSASTHTQAPGLFDPVTRASADAQDVRPAQVDSFDTTCDQIYTRDGVVHFFARHAFDRARSARELSGVRVLARMSRTNSSGVPGFTYELITKGIFVRDDAVAVECGDEATGRLFDRVTFVTPRSYLVDLDQGDPWGSAAAH
jgi:hypothetical protein